MRRAKSAVSRGFRTLAFVGGVAAAGLLPLYGDPRLSPVSHPEWARMVVRSLDLLESGLTDQASQVFATLSGKDSRAYRADRYLKGDGVEVFGEGTSKAIRATAPVGEVTYPLAIARGGDYRLRLRLAGTSEAEAEVTEIGKEKPLRVFRVAPSGAPAWVEAGMAHLDPGVYTAAVLLPTGSVLEWLELAPPCINPIEPRGGWQPAAVTSTHDVAVTALQAVDQESELPPASSPLEWQGKDFQLDDGQAMALAAAGDQGALRSGPKGAHAVLVATLPEPGLYTLSVFGEFPGGQSWLLDGCRKSVLCPSPDASARWRAVLSGVFAAGPHSFSVTLGPDAVVHRLRLERKKDGVEDYAAALKRLGLDLGPEGPVTRAKADEARRFIERRRTLLAAEACGDIVRPSTLVAATPGGAPGAAAGPGATGSGPGGGPGPDPISPPFIPPQEPASPVLPVGFR
ncbi:MAG TPA: hypothetical protein VIC87_08700 [Vicinamibacteria bacterium]